MIRTTVQRLIALLATSSLSALFLLTVLPAGIGAIGKGPCGTCPEDSSRVACCIGDTNGDARTDISDGIYLLQFLFNGGPAPAALAASSQGVPAGAVIAFAGEDIPPGWLLCDGSPQNPADFPELFRAIGTIHGGDGLLAFFLPDLRGRIPRGVDRGAGNDPDAATRLAAEGGGNPGNAGDAVGSLQGDSTAMPEKHFVTVSAGSHNHGGSVSGGSHSHQLGVEYWADACFMSFGCGGQDIVDIDTTPGNFNHNFNITGGSHSHTISAD